MLRESTKGGGRGRRFQEDAQLPNPKSGTKKIGQGRARSWNLTFASAWGSPHRRLRAERHRQY